MVEKIVKSLNIKVSARDSKHLDSKGQLQSIFQQWLPLACSVLGNNVNGGVANESCDYLIMSFLILVRYGV